jgi:hypothetical protein
LQIEEAQNIVKDSSTESLNWKEEKVELLEQSKKSNIKIESLTIEIERLTHYVKLLKEVIYGRKSERLDEEAIKQLGLLFNEAEANSDSMSNE